MLAVLLGAAVGAAGFRLRGSKQWARWTGGGIGTARIFAWSLPVALATWAASALPWHGGLALFVALWLGSLPGWWGSLDLGTNEGTPAQDYALHSLRGVVWVLPALLVLAGEGSPAAAEPLLIAGILCGPIYGLGRAVWPRFAVELGEVLFGGSVGAAIMIAGGI